MKKSSTKLVFQSSPTVTVATNTFTNVPVILQYEDTPLIEIVKEEGIGFTTQIPIYHSDGTDMARVKGNRIYPTEAGKKANLAIRDLPDKFVCSLDGKVMFELTHGVGDAFRANAELYTPDGYFVKCADSLKLLDLMGSAIQIGGLVMSRCSFKNKSIGIWLRKDGSCIIGAGGAG